MSAELGTSLLPIISPVVGALAQFAHWIGENTTLVQIIIGIIGGLALAVIAYTAAQWAMNFAIMANPVGLLVAAIVVLIAAIIAVTVIIIKNWEQIKAFFANVANSIKQTWADVSAWFLNIWRTIVSSFQNGLNQITSFFTSVFNGIKAIVGPVLTWLENLWSSVMNTLLHPVQAIEAAFNSVVAAIKHVIDWLGKIKIPDLGAIGRMVTGQSVAIAGGASVAPMSIYSARGIGSVSPASVTGAGAAGGTVINVNGGLDSADTIARRIRQILDSRDRREYGVRILRSAP
jgi:phage-related protein